MSPQDDLTLIKLTVALEAGGESYDGKKAVAWVIINRMKAWRQQAVRVTLAPYQFSCWLREFNFVSNLERMPEKVLEESYAAAKSAYEGLSIDLTNGATHYLNVELTKKLRGGTLPGWVYKLEKTAVIGQHTFFK